MKLNCLAVFALVVSCGVTFAQEGPQLTTPRLREAQQRALFQPLANNLKLRFPDAVRGPDVDVLGSWCLPLPVAPTGCASWISGLSNSPMAWATAAPAVLV